MASVGKMYLSITLGYILFGFSSWTAAAEFPWNDTADPDWPFQNVTVTDICKNDTKLYFEELNKKWKWPRQVHFAEWSFQMLDSTGKVRDGFFDANLNSLGDQPQCMAVSVEKKKLLWNGTSVITNKFIGAYHVVYTSMDTDGNEENGESHVQNGVCFPSTCLKEEVAGIYGNIRHRYFLIGRNASKWHSTGFVWTEELKDEKKNLDNADRGFIIFLSVWGVLLTLGTLLEYWSSVMQSNCEKYWQKLLLGFGVYKSIKSFAQITKPDIKSGKERLGCLDGIRFMSISWVALCHVLSEYSQSPLVINLGTFFPNNFAKHSSWNMIINGFTSVDSFFLLSGCLVSYLSLKELERSKGRLNFFFFYLHRYLRLTGAYAFILFFHATLYDKFFPNRSDGQRDACRNGWWANMLYVNNFWHVGPGAVESQCLGVTWYMANDMQYFIISPLVFMPLFFFKTLGKTWSVFLLIGATLVPLYTNMINDWPAAPILIGNPGDAYEYMKYSYSTPWNRFSPYMAGLLLGYYLHVTKKPGSFKMSGPAAVLLWIIALALGFSVIFGLNSNSMLAEGLINKPSNLAAGFYAGPGRLAWALAVSWVIFACCRGYGGWINDFLSWEAFQPLSKVSFLVYLLHYDFIDIIMTGRNQFQFPQQFDPFLLAVTFISVMSYTILFSGLVFVLVETPWLNTEKLFMGSLHQLISPTKKVKEAKLSLKEPVTKDTFIT